MYLSKLILNPRCREARRDAAAPYELHRTLSRAFATPPGTEYRAAHGVLFRLEPFSHATALPTVLVQSATEPAWNELPEEYLYQRQAPELKRVEPVFSVDQPLQFRLVGNPTRKQKREGHRQGRRVALLGVAESDDLTPARAWLARKGEQHGFRVLYATTDDFWLGVGRDGRVAKNALPLYGVRFDGLLQVTEPDRLSAALRTGIGPAKAFGFGLLSVARPR